MIPVFETNATDEMVLALGSRDTVFHLLRVRMGRRHMPKLKSQTQKQTALLVAEVSIGSCRLLLQ